jgi:hypothetical protein
MPYGSHVTSTCYSTAAGISNIGGVSLSLQKCHECRGSPVLAVFFSVMRRILLHCDETEWAVPGPSPDVSDQTFPGPEYDLLPLPVRSSPGIFENSFVVPVLRPEFS